MGNAGKGAAYVACVPHVPFTSTQEKAHNPEFWAAYDARVAEFEAFDPELLIAFGADHYANIHLNNAPTFLIGYAAESIDDCGGWPGKLDVPSDLAITLARQLVDDRFDMATSYAMKVDHGFSNALGFFTRGEIGKLPVIPIHINGLTEPRPSLRRCRELGEAVGRWAATLGKRVAFLGSGGLSHATGRIFPQYRDADSDEMRTWLVHGGTEGGITDQQWHDNISNGMEKASVGLIARTSPTTIVPAWDEMFLDSLRGGDLTVFDRWTDAEIIDGGGAGAGEVRSWLAAMAAGRASGAGEISVDYYSGETTLAVGAGVVHAPAMA